MLNIPCWVRNIIKIVKMCHSKRCWNPHLFPDTQLLLAISTTHYPEGWIHAFKHCRFRTSICMLRVWEAMRESWHICLDSTYLEMLKTVAWFSKRLDLESQFLLRILLLHFYEYQHNFIGPANCLCCSWKGWNIFTHSLGKTLPHVRALFGRKEVLQFWPRTSEVQSQH